jgi:hypothetical protein
MKQDSSWEEDSYSAGEDSPCFHGTWVFTAAFTCSYFWLYPEPMCSSIQSTFYSSAVYVTIIFTRTPARTLYAFLIFTVHVDIPSF